jgi:hypothetical protein
MSTTTPFDTHTARITSRSPSINLSGRFANFEYFDQLLIDFGP